MSSDWLGMSASALGREIDAGKIDPVDLAEAYLSAIQAHPEHQRIYARLTPDRARHEAVEARQRAKLGLRRSLLDGVPVSWKDLFDTAGTATEAGSALLAGRVPKRDAKVLSNATNAGVVCLGKTQMSELAFSGIGLNPITETPPNYNDTEAVPGGSSSGAAASVAFGLAAAGIGSDTGGSVRIPAAWNDLVGLKTTSGRLSNQGVVPLCARFDTVGPLTKTVEDAAHLLAILGGDRVADLGGATLEGARLLVLETAAFDDIAGAPRAAFQSAVERLQAAGAAVRRGELPFVNVALALSGILYQTEAYATWRNEIEAAPHKMFVEILKRFRAGASYSGADYVAAWHALESYRRQWADAVTAYDAVILPTAPIVPPNRARLGEDEDYYVTQNLMALRNTRIGNLMEIPALTLPTGVPSTGIMFFGAPWQEERLLRLGSAAEQALA